MCKIHGTHEYTRPLQRDQVRPSSGDHEHLGSFEHANARAGSGVLHRCQPGSSLANLLRVYVYVLAWRGQASRLASGGKGTGGRAQAYRFERNQVELQAHSLGRPMWGKVGTSIGLPRVG